LLHFFGSPNSVPFPSFFIGTLQNTELKNGGYRFKQASSNHLLGFILGAPLNLPENKFESDKHHDLA
jgi:hypothetical protein